MRSFNLVFLLALAANVLHVESLRAAPASEFEIYNLVDELNVTRLRGRLHVPASYATEPTTLRPLILFLHGSGESGTNNLSQINGNIDNLFAAAKTHDAFLYAPQTNSGWEQSVLLDRAMTMIDRAIAERSVDPNRIYVTGLSMGGGGAWNFLQQFSERIAATVPICGVYPTDDFMPAELLDEAIWAFHGRSDTSVPVAVTRNVINSFLAEAGLPAPTYPTSVFTPHTAFDFPPLDLRYTDMRGNHGIWPEVYAMPQLYDWMFAHGAVPEPSSLLISAIVVAGFGCYGRYFSRS
jgi:predicted peptidase